MQGEEQKELEASFSMCPAYQQHLDMQVLHSDLREIKVAVEEMRDIVTAWQDAKAFFKILKVIGEILKWIVAVGAAIGVIWYFISGRKNG